MVTPDYLMGINYPASLQVRTDLQSTDNRPARRVQFKQLLPKVNNLEIAKNVITYTDPTNPLSIFGRWDLGYGETDYPKQIPDGSIDAKAADTAWSGLSWGCPASSTRESPSYRFLDALRHPPGQRHAVHLERVALELADIAGCARQAGRHIYADAAVFEVM